MGGGEGRGMNYRPGVRAEGAGKFFFEMGINGGANIGPHAVSPTMCQPSLHDVWVMFVFSSFMCRQRRFPPSNHAPYRLMICLCFASGVVMEACVVGHVATIGLVYKVVPACW